MPAERSRDLREAARSRMSSPARWARCHSTTSSSASSRLPRRAPAQLAVRPRSSRAPDGPPRAGSLASSSSHLSAPPHSSASRSTIQLTGRASPAAGRSSTPRRRLRALRQLLGEPQIAAERVQHVLPRTHRPRVAHLQRLAGLDRADGVGTSLSSPQSPPPITLPARAVAEPRRALRGEERAPVGAGDELGARLRARVGIRPAERIAPRRTAASRPPGFS